MQGAEARMDLKTQVAQALHVLNHDLQSSNRVAANQWLVQFQRADTAWEVATCILTSSPPYGPQDFELELFAAQVLKRKIQSEGLNLQAEARSALQIALLTAAKNFSAGPPQLLTQVCLALSALVLRAVELKKPIEQLFASLSELQGEGTGTNAILELLTVLPEEVTENQTVNANVGSSARRGQFTQELLSHTTAVLEFLQQQAIDETQKSIQLHDKRRKVLRCLLSWVRAGCFFEIPHSSISTHPLLAFICGSLQTPFTFDIAVEVLTELVSRHKALPEVLLSRVQSFSDGLLLPALANRDEKTIGGMACFLAELGQAAPTLIAKATPEAFSLIDALLRCVVYPSEDWEIADSTLNFWCSFAEYLLNLNTGEDSPKHRDLTAFTRIYAALLDGLLSRAEVTSLDSCIDDIDSSTNLPSGLTLFRHNLEELLGNICCILGPAQFLEQLLNGSWINLQPPIPWEVVEVRFFALDTVAEVIMRVEQGLDLSIIMHAIMTIKNGSADIKPVLLDVLCRSAAEVAGSYAKLLCPSPAALLPLLSFIAAGLTKPSASLGCANALRRICEDIPHLVTDPDNLDGLLWIGEGLPNMQLSLLEEEDVMCAIGCVLSAVNNREILNKSLWRILSPCFKDIEALLKIEKGTSWKQRSATFESAVRALTRLGVLLNQLSQCRPQNSNEDEPVAIVLKQIWPLLNSILGSSLMEEPSLLMAMCRSLTQIINASGQQFSICLPNVLTSICRNFPSLKSNECLIRTAAVALEEFGHDEEFGHLFLTTFRTFNTIEIVSRMSSSYACDQEPELIEAYMGFASTFVRHCPKDIIALAGPLLETSFGKATICCAAMHRGAALAAMSFLSCFLEVSFSSLLESGAHIIEGSLAFVCLRICSLCGESLLSGVVYALLGVSAMIRVQKVVAILQRLAALCNLSEGLSLKSMLGWNSIQGWLVMTVQALPREYLNPGESEHHLLSTWMKALQLSAADYYNSKVVGRSELEGGRALKQVIRDFVDSHQQMPSML